MHCVLRDLEKRVHLLCAAKAKLVNFL